MTSKVLIANRGAIAVRILRSLKSLGIHSIVIYSEADADAPHVRLADEAHYLGEGPAATTYLNQTLIIDIARKSGATAVHPGYGFLSENADFCQSLTAAGIVFLGPTADQMSLFGLKHEARQLAAKSQVPLLPGSDLLSELEHAVPIAEEIGYPVMLKSTAGGGGIGMQVCWQESELRSVWDSIKRLGENNFSNSGVFLEKYVDKARHIEVQVFGDGEGGVLVLGDRDCSTQRRNQKVLEEAPAPNIPDDVRSQLHQVAKQLAVSVQYRSAGTVEFIYDQVSNAFYFLEMNTRLQVEHGVTEEIFGVDLVEWMVKLGLGELPGLQTLGESLTAKGHAIQARIYAENPNKQFQPSAGLLTHVYFPQADKVKLRIDHWVAAGQTISSFYDPMLAKMICYAPDRATAIAGLDAALLETVIQGVESNVDYVHRILETDVLKQGRITTRTLSTLDYQPLSIDVLSAGTLTTIQDYPGRMGYWDVGVPPSGPYDALAFRLGNQLLGNDSTAPGLEMTHQGAVLKFNCPCQFVLTGAFVESFLDDLAIDPGVIISALPGQVLKVGKIKGVGARAYLLFDGGIKCEPYLGSCATFPLGKFGGISGAALKAGDVLNLHQACAAESTASKKSIALPTFSNRWQLRVTYGPHGAPEFFTDKDMAEFFKASWKVHYNSSRTGTRLIGPKPDWARTDGGEAGMHPSNIHDNAYAIGAVDFTGDMPVILGPDGPSLGGFVCPVTVVSADLWKLGQFRAGDTVKFSLVDLETAVELKKNQERAIAELNVASAYADVTASDLADKLPTLSPILKTIPESQFGTTAVYRQSGDDNILIEYGPHMLDIQLRFRVHALMLLLQTYQQQDALLAESILDLTPGIRSLQVHFDPLKLPQASLLNRLEKAESELVNLEDMSVPARIVHLPLSWDDEQCRIAIEKYMQSVRKEAPWCPSNIEFIRRINGLDSVDEVKRIVFEASYLVMGLGDVYLGAPVATPLDPRHRLVTTKYNPARTWTAENSVGIGGSYLCIYGMEGPGGYQFVGRTSQMWNRYKSTQAFDKPWLLEFFDQIKFYEVTAEELKQIRKDVPNGDYPIKIEKTTFSLKDYLASLEENQKDIRVFTQKRNAAFAQELQHWKDSGQLHFESDNTDAADAEAVDIPEDCEAIESPVSGSIWIVQVSEGAKVKAGQVLCVLESMKMEIDITAPGDGEIKQILKSKGQGVNNGDPLFVFKPLIS